MTAGLYAHQLGIITEAARSLPPDKRDVFLQRVDAMLRHRRHGKRFDDADVREVAALARFGLVVPSADKVA